MAWGSGGGWGPKKSGGKGGGDKGGQGGAGGQQGKPINAASHSGPVPSNFPGALEDHPDWVSDGGPNGSCSAHPGGCKDALKGQVG